MEANAGTCCSLTNVLNCLEGLALALKNAIHFGENVSQKDRHYLKGIADRWLDMCNTPQLRRRDAALRVTDEVLKDIEKATRNGVKDNIPPAANLIIFSMIMVIKKLDEGE